MSSLTQLMCPVRCFIALGSNLNNPSEQIKTAISNIDALPDTNLLKASSLYVTKAVLPPERPDEEQPDYCNAVVMIETTLSPVKLMRTFLDIEEKMGRRRSGKRWEARLIDLDLLLYGDEKIKTPFLTIPHPEIKNRLFVLEPLFEIAPDVIL